MQSIKLTASLLFIVIFSSCLRKGPSIPFEEVIKCDTTYVSPYTYKCRGVTYPEVKEGFCEEYISGFKTAEGSFKNGKPDGAWKFWFRSNPVRMEGTYRNGLRHGSWNYYENDKLFFTLIYTQDSISDSIRVMEFTPKVKPDGSLDIDQRKPQFTAGDALAYIRSKACYPESSKNLGIQGTVWVEFVINETGGVQDIRIVKSPPNALDLEQEVMRVIKQLPRFSPGMQAYKPVKVKFTVPVKFSIR